MLTTDFTSLADPSDFCRYCRGSGSIATPTERGTTLHEDCDRCGGRGFKTVAILPPVAPKGVSA